MAEQKTIDIIAEKDDDRVEHPFFMYESIHKIAEYTEKCLDERILGEINAVADVLISRDIKRLIVVGCGTPQYTAMSNRIVWYQFDTGIEIVFDDGLDLLNYNYLYVGKNDAVLGISHSGGTKATEDYVKYYKDKGITTIVITDNKESRVDKASEFSIIGPGGVDRSIPKTRSYVTHSYMFTLLGAYVAEKKGKVIDWDTIKSIPAKIDETNSNVESPIKELADKFKDLNNCFLVGSGVNYATITEGALKIIESTMIPALHAQVEETAHGFDLLFDDTYFSVVLVPNDMILRERMFHIIKGMKIMDVKVIILCNDKEFVSEVSDGTYVVEMKGTLPEVYSFFTFIVPIYYLAYFITVNKGLHPDKSASVKPEFKEAFLEFMPEGYH